MDIQINITEAVNGYRVDIRDFKEANFHHENTETAIETLQVVKRFVDELLQKEGEFLREVTHLI